MCQEPFRGARGGRSLFSLSIPSSFSIASTFLAVELSALKP